MSPRFACLLRPDRVAMGIRWLVLMVILFGALISSVGSMNSHGIAAIAAAVHADPVFQDDTHDHAHSDAHEDDDGDLVLGHGASSDHPHHGADHSHDKAHALPAAWRAATPPLPVWFGDVGPWIESVQASRLERPPMG
jgi:hypothetical protein